MQNSTVWYLGMVLTGIVIYKYIKFWKAFCNTDVFNTEVL